MPTETDRERVESIEEHPGAKATRSQRLLSGKAAAAAVVAALVATLGVVVTTVVMDGSDSAPSPHSALSTAPQPEPFAEQTTQPAAQHTTQPARPGAGAFSIAMDDRGFVNSKARCEGTQSAVAIGRTSRSVVVVCRSPNNQYAYTGMRLSDGASLQLGDVRVTAQGFEARGDGARYLISATELVAMSGDAVLSRDPILEYRTPTANR
jgi:hypothetical protein